MVFCLYLATEENLQEFLYVSKKMLQAFENLA